MTLLALVLTVSLSELWQHATRETSSHAAAARGVTAFARKKYDEAMASFARANAIRPTPQSAFNLGTSQIAGGKQEEGSTTLQKALADRRLRADALYNRGNSALAAKAFDYAIRDYVDTLKLRPADANAKRNLEIALQRKQQQEQQQKQQQQQQQGGGKQQQPQQPQPKPGQGNKDEQKPKSDPNVEALLRSVQQQEREELARMNRPRPERLRVGW
ncbi:MAG TPA: hypothetical protein VN605_06480 [Thermoanaerobaculia bacterium]|nr:hypothetical protein [Thermoanaerobaculia bacterium]